MGRAFEYRKAAKMKRWGMMSRVFPKLGNRITAAAKDGGSDPEMNPSLRTAIQNAKAANMPKDNIQSAIKRATASDYKAMTEVNYEGKGPHGVLVFVECATDNTTRTVANVKSYFNKAGGAVVPTGSLEFMFERKAIFELINSDELDIEELELELIDAGLEEIEEVDEHIIISSDYKAFGKLGLAMEALKLEINKSELERFPTSPQTFTEEQMVDIDKMLTKLHEDDDVQEVFTNIG